MIPSSKKGVETNQIFIFITSIVVIGLILLIGTRAIINWQDRVEEVEYLQFKSTLESAIDDVASDFGSVRKLELKLPSDFEKICFVGDILQTGFASADLDIDGKQQPLLLSEWRDGTANIFLIDDVVAESMNNEKIIIENNEQYSCFTPQFGRVTLRLEGKGKSTAISQWSS